MKPDDACDRIAAGQHWVISRDQALEGGMTPRMIGHRLKTETWRLELPSTYIVRAAASTWMQHLFAAWLWAGSDSVISHRAAGQLWELDGCPSGFVEVSTSRNLRSSAVLTHSAYTGPRFRRKDLPVTPVDLTVSDLASVLPASRLERVVDDALRRNLTTLERLRRPLLRSGRAKDGAPKLHRVLEERGTFDERLESRLETEFMKFVVNQALPIPMAQVRIVDQARCLARVDFMYPEKELVIEVDGYEFHSGKVPWQRDMWRGNELTVRGLRTLRFSRSDLRRRPQQVANQIVAAYQLKDAR
jgi:very-short-patch-repair endonuclease